MARLIPSSINNLMHTTAGERKLYSLFAKFPDDCFIRYEMIIGERDRRPDFTIFSPLRGVAIIEVKDWGIESFHKITREQFWITGFHGSKQPRVQMNPELKCQVYLKEAKEHMVAMPGLRNDNYQLTVPIGFLIALPNISLEDFSKLELNKVIDPDNVLFKEDLLNSDNLLYKFFRKFPLLHNTLSSVQMEDITKALIPDITIPHVIPGIEMESHRNSVLSESALYMETYCLNPDQESIAKGLGEGPRLLRGIAGTGKTLIMLYRAKLLAANNPDIKILILCWNVSLSNYMRQVYEKLQFDSRAKVEINSFTKFIFTLDEFRQKAAQITVDSQEFNETLSNIRISESMRYDAVYIDEAQDFRSEWIEFIYNNLLNGDPKDRNLLIAADDAQRIYCHRSFSWANLGIPMVGRSKVLRTIYRNSKKVWLFAALVIGKESIGEQIGDEKINDKLQFAAKGEFDPVILECRDTYSQIMKVVEILRKMLSSGFSARNVMLLYKGKGVNGFPIESLMSVLEKNNIEYDWITEDKESRRNFNWEINRIKISTVASAKGMDSPIVIIVGAENFGNNADLLEDDIKLLYVGLTRARESLVVLYSGEGKLIPRLLEAKNQYAEIAESI